MTITALSGKDFNVTDMLNEDSLSDLSLYSGMDETDINDDAFDMNKLNSKEKEALGLIQTKLGISIDKLQTYDMDTVAGLMAIARAMDAVEKNKASEGAELDAQKDLLKSADNFLGKLYGADPTIMPAIDQYKAWVEDNKDEFDDNIQPELTDGLKTVFNRVQNKAGGATGGEDEGTPTAGEDEGTPTAGADEGTPTAADNGTDNACAATGGADEGTPTAGGANKDTSTTPAGIITATVSPKPSAGDADFSSKSMQGDALTVDPNDPDVKHLSDKLLVYTGTGNDRKNAELLLNKIIEMYKADKDFAKQLDKVIEQKDFVAFTVTDIGEDALGKALVGTKTEYQNEILIDMKKHKKGTDETELKDTIAHELLHNLGFEHGNEQDSEISTMIDNK